MVSFRGLDLAESQQAQVRHRAVSRHFFPVDRLLLGYVGVVSAVALSRLSSFPDCGWLLLANALVVALVLMVTRSDLGPFGRLVHDAYPILLLIALYASLDILNGGGRVAVHDAMVSVEGKNMEGVTWVIFEEVKSGDWSIGGKCLTAADVKKLQAGG